MNKNSFLNKTIKYVDLLFNKKDLHFVRTLYWVLKLDPGVSEEVKIAAYAHDIERALFKYNIGAFLLDEEVLRNHQMNGAKAIYDFLLKEGASPAFSSRVKKLIEKHEIGGTYEQNLIKDADSISYFETNALKHVEWIDKFSKEQIQAKLDWMYNRISFEKTKEIAKPFYEKSIKKLEEEYRLKQND